MRDMGQPSRCAFTIISFGAPSTLKVLFLYVLARRRGSFFCSYTSWGVIGVHTYIYIYIYICNSWSVVGVRAFTFERRGASFAFKWLYLHVSGRYARSILFKRPAHSAGPSCEPHRNSIFPMFMPGTFLHDAPPFFFCQKTRGHATSPTAPLRAASVGNTPGQRSNEQGKSSIRHTNT